MTKTITAIAADVVERAYPSLQIPEKNCAHINDILVKRDPESDEGGYVLLLSVARSKYRRIRIRLKREKFVELIERMQGVAP